MSINHSTNNMDLQRQPKIPFRQDYPVPEGYDEGFSQRVLARLEKIDDATALNSGGGTIFAIWRGNARVWAVAASLALVVGAWFLGRFWWSGPNPAIVADSTSGLLAQVRVEEAHEELLQGACWELLEEAVEQDPHTQVLLSAWADQISNEPVSLQEALPSLPHDLGELVDETEAEI